MKIPSTLPLAATALVLTLGAACDSALPTPTGVEQTSAVASVSHGAVVLSATGAGNGVYSFEPPATGWRTFAFNAKVHADGTAEGQLEVHNTANDNGLHGEVVCMNAIGDGIYGIAVHVTRLYGTFAAGQLPNLTGDYAVFAVRDNGEGAKAAPDQFTGVDLTGVTPGGTNLALAVCAHPAAFGFVPAVVASLMVDLQDGNIQVHDKE